MKKKTMLFGWLVMVLILICSIGSAEIKPPKEVNQSDDCVIFGTYEQWNCYTVGLELIDNGKEPIEWIVLAEDDSKLLLVSKYPLDYQQYDSQKGKYTWKNSSIRSWLNNTFIKSAFTPEEEAAILSVKIESGGFRRESLPEQERRRNFVSASQMPGLQNCHPGTVSQRTKLRFGRRKPLAGSTPWLLLFCWLSVYSSWEITIVPACGSPAWM